MHGLAKIKADIVFVINMIKMVNSYCVWASYIRYKNCSLVYLISRAVYTDEN